MLRRVISSFATLGSGLADSVPVSRADDLQKRTDAFADLSILFVQGFPDTAVARRLAAQYQDASTSTAANYRAARALTQRVRRQDWYRVGRSG
jgi:hypothetical protein